MDTAPRIPTIPQLHGWLSTAWPAVIWWLRRDALPLLFFCGIALLAMSPVLATPRTHILGLPGDNLQYAYITGWVAQALRMGASPFVDPRLNYPDDLLLTGTDAPFLSVILAAPATWALGPVFGYNLIIFVSHILTGYFTYLWLLTLTGSRAGAIIAGLLFMLAPYRTIRSYAQLNLISTQAIPLFFWALHHALTCPQRGELRLWLLGAATLLVGLLSQYYLIICLTTGIAYALLLNWRQPLTLLIPGWRIAFSVAIGALLSALPYLSSLSTYAAYGVARTRLWSADPLNFLLPPTTHPLWGTLVASFRSEPYIGEKTLYVGIVALVLAGLGYWRGPAQLRQHRTVWLGTVLVGFVFALGTDLWLNNTPLSISHPFWLPAYYLAHLPLIGSMRVWARFGIITIFFIALLAGLGAAWLVARQPRRIGQLATLALLIVLIGFDFMPANLGTTALGPRAVDTWLAAHPDDFAVAFLPPENDLVNYRAMFGSLYHGKHLPAFMHSRHMPSSYRRYMLATLSFPSPAALHELQTLQIRYIILDSHAYTGWRGPAWADLAPQIEQEPRLHFVTELDGYVVLELAK